MHIPKHISVAFGAGELAHGRANAHGTVSGGWPNVFGRKALPITKDVLPKMLEVHFSFQRGTEKTFPVCLVEDGDDTATTSNQLMRRNKFHFQAFDWGRNFIHRNMVRGRFVV